MVTRWNDAPAAGLRSCSAAAPPGPWPGIAAAPATAVRDQSMVGSCVTANRAVTKSTMATLASSCFMSILLLSFMGFQQRAERFGVEPTVCVRRTEPLLEGPGIRRAVQQL